MINFYSKLSALNSFKSAKGHYRTITEDKSKEREIGKGIGKIENRRKFTIYKSIS